MTRDLHLVTPSGRLHGPPPVPAFAFDLRGLRGPLRGAASPARYTTYRALGVPADLSPLGGTRWERCGYPPHGEYPGAGHRRTPHAGRPLTRVNTTAWPRRMSGTALEEEGPW